jgi:hypothetical protein
VGSSSDAVTKAAVRLSRPAKCAGRWRIVNVGLSLWVCVVGGLSRVACNVGNIWSAWARLDALDRKAGNRTSS